VNKLYLSLLLRLFKQKVWVPDNLVTLFLNLINFWDLRQELRVVLLIVFHSLFGKELLTHICPRIKFFRSKLHIYKVCFFQDFANFVHFLALEVIDVEPKIVKEVVNCMSYAMAEVELFTVCNLCSILDHLIKLFVNVLDEVLGSCLQEEDLIVVISMVRKITAFFAHKFIMNDTEGYILFLVIRARLCLAWRRWALFSSSFATGAGNSCIMLILATSTLFRLLSLWLCTSRELWKVCSPRRVNLLREVHIGHSVLNSCGLVCDINWASRSFCKSNWRVSILDNNTSRDVWNRVMVSKHRPLTWIIIARRPHTIVLILWLLSRKIWVTTLILNMVESVSRNHGI